MTDIRKQHYLNSSFREKLIEHLFVGELLKLSWKAGPCSLEIAKPEVDCQGYDIVAEENGVIRHIQLKASYHDATTAQQKVHIALASKPSGCIIWIYFDEETLELGPFLFYGGPAGEPVPDLSDQRVPSTPRVMPRASLPTRTPAPGWWARSRPGGGRTGKRAHPGPRPGADAGGRGGYLCPGLHPLPFRHGPDPAAGGPEATIIDPAACWTSCFRCEP
ncbi:MAG: hypothetical protein PVJ75_16120 [Chloroflexota bacterium]|jgi:hypothetical protein